MRRLIDLALKGHARNIGSAAAVAAFNTMNGTIIGAVFSYMLTGFGALFGIGLQMVFDHFGYKAISGFGLTFFLIFFVLSVFSLIFMLLGRFATGDDDMHDEKFNILFIGYGFFAVMVIAQIYSYYQYDPSIFSEQNVTFWQIARYVYQLTFIGFIPDVVQYSPLEPNLTAVGHMHIVQFVLKLIMALTVISGTLRYLESKYHISLPF